MTEPELPDTAMATGNDYQPGVPAGPLDPEERAVLDHLENADGDDVVEQVRGLPDAHPGLVDHRILPSNAGASVVYESTWASTADLKGLPARGGPTSRS